MINEREILILEMLLEKEIISLEYICNFFNVSKRAIQYNLNNINYYLSKSNFSKIGIKNGNVVINKRDEIKKILDIMEEEYVNREDRINLIYLYALFNKKGLNISQLANKINISRNTLKLDMKLLDGEKFEYIYSKGYFLDWSNDKKLSFLDNVYSKKGFSKYINEVLDIDFIKKIKNFLKEVSQKIKLNINEEVHQRVLLSIYCSLKFPEKINNSIKFDLGKDENFIKKIYKKYFNEEENFKNIAEMLVGLSINPNLKSWLDESFLIKKLIKFVSEKIGIDLTEDKILFDFLFSHIKVSIYRLKKNITLKNSIYQQLILEDDSIIPIVKEAVSEMEEIFSIKFTEIEISLISYHFKASIERMRTFNRKKIILVCGLGYGTSRILEYNLKEKFDIDIVDVLPGYMIDKIGFKNQNVDYILSTVELEKIDYIKINPLLKVSDYEKLDKLGIKRRKDKILLDDFLEVIGDFYNKSNKKILKEILMKNYSNIFIDKYNFDNSLIKVLDDKSVIFKDEVENWEEAIRILGKNLEKKGSISNEYTDEMIKIVKKLGSYIVIGKGVAIPHAKLEKSVFKTDASILILKKPIKFPKGKNVRLLFSFASKDNSSHLDILGEFYKLILDEKTIQNIINIDKYDDLILFLKNKFEI